ncbi:MAG: hypothetical protein GY820_42485 [Gammaproteobacteria bacterium]|nr:hypothetical protein [Gammaproteobacteria bacterium]
MCTEGGNGAAAIKIEREGKALGGKKGREEEGGGEKRREWGDTVRCAPAILVPRIDPIERCP